MKKHVDLLKKAAALAAAEAVLSGTIVGLGSGSTLVYVIEALGERQRRGELRISGVPTSYQARLLAQECGIPIQDPMEVDRLDIAIDGADEIDPAGNLIKGAGAAHVGEKLVAAMAEWFVVVVDETKLVNTLGARHAVPVEVIAPALAYVLRYLRELGGEPVIRSGTGKAGPIISDLGNLILDVDFGPIADAERLNRDLNGLPGVVGHGLFVGMADQAIVARAAGEGVVIERLRLERKPFPCRIRPDDG